MFWKTQPAIPIDLMRMATASLAKHCRSLNREWICSDEEAECCVIEPSAFELLVGSSSRDVRLAERFEVHCESGITTGVISLLDELKTSLMLLEPSLGVHSESLANIRDIH